MLNEYRCPARNNLLCKAKGIGVVEIKNTSNGITSIIWPSRILWDINPPHVNFYNYCFDFRCKNCKKLLWKWLGIDMVCEIKCPKCNYVNTYKMESILNGVDQEEIGTIKSNIIEILQI